LNPLKPEKGEKYVGVDTGIIYEWDGQKWVNTGKREDIPKWLDNI
jgi:hypothetical protein